MIRRATEGDLSRMLELAEGRRAEYERAQPRFWRRAADGIERQRPFFARQLADERVIALVYEAEGGIAGFAIGVLMAAPPVVDPGGDTCLVDDFVVAGAADWATSGTALLATMREEARSRGAVQVVVICGHHDGAKRAMLADAGCTVASEWWVGEV